MVEDNEVKRGTIRRTYHSIGMFIVEYDDGDVAKAPEAIIAHEPKTETKTETKAEPEIEEKHEDEPRMRSEITITPDEFRNIAIGALTEYVIRVDNADLGFEVIPILVEISKALFMEKESENSDNVE